MPDYSTNADEIEADICSLPITFDSLPSPEIETLSWSDQRLMEEFFYEAQEGTARSIRTFKHLSRKYPNVVFLKNHLCVAYAAAGKGSLANQLTKEIFESHPDYLFGRANFAALFLKEGSDLDRIPELLGETLRLRDLKPDVDLFHFSQIRAFYDIVALFHLRNDRPDLAKAIHRLLEEIIGEDDPTLQRLQLEIASYHLDWMKRRWEQDEARAIRVSVVPPLRPDESVDLFPPGFHHPEIEAFYRFDFELSDSLIETILALPRKTLVRDLEAVLKDGLVRGELYEKERIDFEDEESFFPLHAIFFLGELKASESLPLVLDVLTQSEEAIDFWFGDYLARDFWQPLFQIAGDRLDQTTAWMLSPGIPSRSRETVAMAAVQIALHLPERRAEILAWFQGILEFLLDSPPEDNILDTDLVTGLVWGLLTLRAVELQPLITAHFEKGYIAVAHVGDLDEIEESLSEPPSERDRKPLRSLRELYDRLRNPKIETPFPPMGGDLERQWGNPARPGPISAFPEPPLSVGNRPEKAPQDLEMASSEPQIKVGRNEPCPCGSGKKYKKCCG